MNMAQFIEKEKCNMFDDLRDIVSDLTDTMRCNPKDYIEPGTDEPSIDIRLCIDGDTWIFRTGPVDYDQVHSEHCAASSVQLDTNPNSLLNDLINQIELGQ